MSAIITPALVRRYLLASGFEALPTGAIVRRGTAILLFEGMLPGDIEHEIARIARAEDKRPHDLSARLGMLAAAEKLHASFEANWAPGEGASVERFVRGEIRGYTLAAGLTPEAWEEAKGR